MLSTAQLQLLDHLPAKFELTSTDGNGTFTADALGAVSDVVINGGTAETKGNYSFDINSAFEGVSDTFDLELGNGNTITD